MQILFYLILLLTDNNMPRQWTPGPILIPGDLKIPPRRPPLELWQIVRPVRNP